MKDKVVLCICLLFAIFTLPSCNNLKADILTFKGESQNWEAILIQEATELWEGDRKYYSSHVKHELKSKGTYDYSMGPVSYDICSIGGVFRSLPPRNGIFSGNMYTSSRDIFTEDTIFTVTVEWDGKKESFNLSSIK